jgi:hypothetical protein
MTLTTRRMILEVFRGSHCYVKLGRYEAFLNLARGVGEDRFSWSRGERARTGEAS